ncbi:MAG: hypothetical protein AAFQ15_15015 [Pseudomonadota bacterium]
MTAPDTNVRKQARWHVPALVAITVALSAAAFAAFALFGVWDGVPTDEQAAPTNETEVSR